MSRTGGGRGHDRTSRQRHHIDTISPEKNEELNNPPHFPMNSTEDHAIFHYILSLGRRLLVAALLIAIVIILVSLGILLAQEGGWGAVRETSLRLPQVASRLVTALARGEADSFEAMWTALPRSLILLMLATLFGTIIGVSLGGLAAFRRESSVASLLTSASVLGISTPSYVVAMFLIWMVVWGQRTSGVRLLPVFGFGWDSHLLLPLIVLASRPTANMMRLTQSALVDIFQADYVRTAHSKGLQSRTVFWRHVLRNAGVPLLTSAVASLRFSLSTLPVVEYIFTWPGVGLALLQSVQSGDLETVIVMLLPLVIAFVGINLILGLIYGVIDARLLESEPSAA